MYLSTLIWNSFQFFISVCVCGIIDAMMLLEISFVSVENEKKKRHILTLFLSAFREWRFFLFSF